MSAALSDREAIAYLAVTDEDPLILLVHRAGAAPVVERIPPSKPSFTGRDLSRLLVQFDGDEVVGGFLPGQLGAGEDVSRVDSRDLLYRALEEGLPLLGRALVERLAARLGALHVERVTLVPCGRLGLLPLHAASYGDDEGSRCLLDEFDVAYAPSARALAAARAMLAPPAAAATLAGVGNPLPNARPLAHAQAELVGIAAYFVRPQAEFKERATKQWLTTAAGRSAYVHLACHGNYDSDDPLDSKVELAQHDKLTLRDVLTDRPFAAARLIVASACQTGINEFTRLPDEVIGLPAGFIQAGTPGVIATLWSVEDLSTALLMIRFYELHRQGDEATCEGPMAPARAMRRAQRWLADATVRELGEYCDRHPALQAYNAFRNLPNQDHRRYASPFHWAPFQLIGA